MEFPTLTFGLKIRSLYYDPYTFAPPPDSALNHSLNYISSMKTTFRKLS